MKKFELPEQPQKTNTSKEFTVAKEAIANLDKFDYAWKTYSHKIEKRFTAAIKYIEELERENQRLIAENVAVKTLVDKAKPQQALPVVPECVAEWYESHGESSESLEFYIYLFCGKFYSSRDSRKNRELTNFEKWFGEDKNKPIETLIRMQDGYQVKKPQLFRVCLLDGRHTLTRRDPRKTLPFNYTFLWSYSSELKEMREINREVDLFTEQEIKSIDERYWQFAVPVEDVE